MPSDPSSDCNPEDDNDQELRRVPLTVPISGHLLHCAKVRAKELGFESVEDYISSLIRGDVLGSVMKQALEDN